MTTLLLVNARVHTLDPHAPLVEALAVRDGRVVASGTTRELRARHGSDARVIDLGRRTVLPGFVDPHTHLSLAALEGCSSDCRTPPLRDVAGVQAALRRAAAREPGAPWIRGWGYSQHLLAEQRHPTRAELDDAVPDRPVLLLHYSHHIGVANSPALEAAGIGAGTPDPPGGSIERGPDGAPTGLLIERALGRLEVLSRRWAETRFREGVAAACRRYAALGITTAGDAAVTPHVAERYREASKDGALAIRVQMMAVSGAGWFEAPWQLAHRRWDAGGPNLLPGPLKVFVDGGYHCAVRLRQGDEERRQGVLFYAPPELAELLTRALGEGWRVTCHAVGNLGVETAIAAVGLAERRVGVLADRVRLDHATFLTPELIRRLGESGLWVVGQPSFHYDATRPPSQLPPGLQVRPFRSLAEAGTRQAFSSDYPCASVDPRRGIYAAVTRRARTGNLWGPEEAISVEDAFRYYTLDAARAAGVGDDAGSLEAGKRADLVVYEQDPMTIAPEELLSLKVVATLVAGEVAAGKLPEMEKERSP